MKPSYYNITSINPDTGQTILFNTLYGGTVAIDRAHLSTVTEILGGREIGRPNQDQLKIIQFLTRGKFLVDDSVDELAIIKHRKYAGIKDKNRADVILMPNMDCNFACPYCYENHDRKKRMSTDTESKIISWLGRVIDSHKLVLLNWFGGEPLLSYKTILSISRFALDRASEKNVQLLSHVTTNGYALTKNVIDQFLSIKIYNYQITIDGPPKTHNKTRILRSGKGTFDRVLSNVIALAEAAPRVKVSLRVNFNHTNLSEIPELLSLVPIPIRPQLRIVLEPIFGDPNLSATNNISPTEISRALTEYYLLAQEMGFDVVHGGLGVGKLCYCYAEREHQFIVDYDANVYKCSVSNFDPSERVGFITKEGVLSRDEKQWDKWFLTPLFEEGCEKCSFLPLCMGGCKKDRLDNRRTGSYCHLIPTNTTSALKSIAFGSFSTFLRQNLKQPRTCALDRQSAT